MASERLGALVSSHPPDPAAEKRQTRAARWVGLLGRFVIAVALVAAIATREGSYLLSLGGLGALLAAAGWLVARQARKSTFLTVDVYEDGVWCETAYDTDHLRWDEIKSAEIDASAHSSGWGDFKFLFQRIGGPDLELNVATVGTTNAYGLLDAILRGVGAHVRPGAEAELAGSKVLSFGELQLHRDWLEHDGERFGWDDIDGLRLHDGRLRGRALGKHWFSVPVRKVPNMPVLLRLLSDRVEPSPTVGDWINEYGD